MPKTATVLFLFRYIIRRNMPPEKQKESNHMDTKDSSVIHMKNAPASRCVPSLSTATVPPKITRSIVRLFCVPKVSMPAKWSQLVETADGKLKRTLRQLLMNSCRPCAAKPRNWGCTSARFRSSVAAPPPFSLTGPQTSNFRPSLS